MSAAHDGHYVLKVNQMPADGSLKDVLFTIDTQNADSIFCNDWFFFATSDIQHVESFYIPGKHFIRKHVLALVRVGCGAEKELGAALLGVRRDLTHCTLSSAEAGVCLKEELPSHMETISSSKKTFDILIISLRRPTYSFYF